AGVAVGEPFSARGGDHVGQGRDLGGQSGVFTDCAGPVLVGEAGRIDVLGGVVVVEGPVVQVDDRLRLAVGSEERLVRTESLGIGLQALADAAPQIDHRVD